MTDGASPVPRRALPAADAAPEAPTRARRALPPDDPPPAPVLPPSHWAPSSAPSAGRHFSADDLPDDWAPAKPRRSASSPADWATSPASPGPVAPPILAIPAPALPAPPAAALPAPTADRLPRWALPGVGGVAVVAVIAAMALLGRPQAGAPAASATTTGGPRGVLAQAAELASLVPGATWAATDDLAPDETRGLRCALPVAQQAVRPLAGSLQRRTFTATAGAAATVVQQIERYASAEDAQRGFAARLAQLGGCAATPDLVRQGLSVTGLGERAGGVQVAEQNAAGAVHDLLVVQAGATVTLVDAQAGASAPAPQALAQAFTAAVGRACTEASASACPTTPVVATAPPPAGEPAGFLTAGDLPLVTPGTGAWVGAQIKPMKLAGSGCEGLDLTAPPKGTAVAQQAFVLTGDPKASAHFGLDEVVYSFATSTDAKAFVDAVVANISACSKKQPAAKATSPGKLPGGYGQLFTIELRTTLDKVALSRVLVAASGTRAVYVAANPTAQFDLADASWLGVLQRAVSRAAQLP